MPRRFNVSAAVCVERCAVSAMTPRTASARAVLAPCALRRCAENFLIRLRRLGIVGLIRLRQRLAPYASNRSSDLVGRRFCLCRLVLDYLHRMTLRRIHAKQCRAALGDLEQKQTTPDVAILEGLGAKGLLQRVELNQLQCQCATQKLIAIKLDRMPVQGRIHLIDCAAMISSGYARRIQGLMARHREDRAAEIVRASRTSNDLIEHNISA